jgi:excisionase family DNA binding protein
MSRDAKMTDGLMTIPELANYLKVELRTLCRYLKVHPLAHKDAQLPAVRMGGRWRFRKEDIDRWLLEQPALQTHAPQQPRILVVDDDENFRMMLLDLFEATGYMVQGVEDGEAALALLRDMTFDLLLVDLQMPGMGGIELIRQAKSLQHHARVIVLTGYAGTESVIEATSLGVMDIIEKPIPNLRAFESTVQLALGRKTLPLTDHRKVSVTVNGGQNGNGSCLNKSPLPPPSMTNGVTVPSEVGLVGEYVGSGLNTMVKERT